MSDEAAGGDHVAEARRTLLAAAGAIAADAVAADRRLTAGQLVGVGWATVELERAERELGQALGAELRTTAAPRDETLGAAQRVATTTDLGFRLVLLEPDTEGPLAGLLARRGEGVVAAYFELPDRTIRLALTSDRDGRSPRSIAVRPPWAPG